VLFVSGLDNEADIWIIDSDGTNLKNLTDNKVREANASWSPDGKVDRFYFCDRWKFGSICDASEMICVSALQISFSDKYKTVCPRPTLTF